MTTPGTDVEGRMAPDAVPPETKDSAKEPTKDSEPAFVQALRGEMADLKETIRDLDASNKTLQGQVRGYEARLNQPTRTAQPEPDILKDVDTSDPDVARLVAVIKAQGAELSALKGAVSTATMSNQERTEREGWIAFLVDQIASPLGVDRATVENAIRSVPTDQLAIRGAEAVVKAVKGKAPTADAIAAAKEEGKKEALKQLESQGLYSGAEAHMRGGTSKAKDSLTAEDLKKMTPQQIVDLKLTDDDKAAILNRH